MLELVLLVLVICAIYISGCWLSFVIGKDYSDYDLKRENARLKALLSEASKNDARDPKTGKFVKRSK